ncbi:hypothetical protein GEMRC1_011672 [Eukaryota sp. GEM-RC1]
MTSSSVKPSRGRPKGSVTTCSVCKAIWHTKTTCRVRKALSDEATLVAPSIPPDSVSCPQLLSSASVDVISKVCLFCASPICGFNVAGRPLLVCDSCFPKDPCRPPFRIPTFVSPAHYSSLAFSLFGTLLFCGSSFCPSLFAQILKKSVSGLPSSMSPQVLKKRFESLALRSQYSSALGLLEESSPAAFNDATLSALEKLLPHEDFVINYCVSSAEVDYYTTNPITASEILGCIRSLPSGRAAGPSGLSYDHLKAVINICSEVPRRLL